MAAGERVPGERRYWDAQGWINEYWSQREGDNPCGVSAETPAVDGAATFAWAALRDEVFVDVDGWEGFLFELDPLDEEQAKQLRRLVRDQFADNLYEYWHASIEVDCSIEDAASAVEGATFS